MSLLGSVRPPPTHKAMDLARLVSLGQDIEESAPEGTVNHASLQGFSDSDGVPLREAYAAAAFNPSLRFDRPSDVAFTVCAGGCQSYGALEHVDTLVRLRAARETEGLDTFDLCTKTCLDACDRGPVVAVATADGTTKLMNVTAASLEQAVADALGD